MVHRIAQLADLHLSSKLPWGKTTIVDGQKTNSRQEEIKRALYYVAQRINETKCGTVVIAGDIYDTYKPDERSRDIFAQFLRLLSIDQSRSIIIITGQHDVGSENPHWATETLATKMNPNIIFYCGTDPWVIEVGGQDYFLVPYQAVSSFRKQLADLNFIEQMAKGSYKNTIFVGHFPISGFKAEKEKGQITSPDWVSLDQYDMLLRGFKVVMMGDIHMRQMSYSGSLIRLDFGDDSLEKGFYIWEFEDGKELAKNFEVIPNSTEFIVVKEDNVYFQDDVKNKIVRVETTLASNLIRMTRWCEEAGAQLVVPKLITKLVERVNKVKGLTNGKLDIEKAILDYVEKVAPPESISKEDILEAGVNYATN
jgi:DNA repair exonuclease SbcCD nuclease subunit